MGEEQTKAIAGQYGPFHMISLSLPGMDNQTSVRIFMIKGGEKTALIDSGIPDRYDQIMQAFGELDLAKTDLDYLLLTHEHMDHVGNNGRLVKDTGCEVWAHPERADRIADNMLNAKTIVHAFPDVEPLFDLEKEYLSWMGPEATPVDKHFTDGDIVDLGNIQLEVIELLGHSMAEVGFYHDESKVLVIADPLMPAYDLVLNLYEDPNLMQATHKKIINLIHERGIQTMLSAHHYPLSAEEAIAWAEECYARVNTIGEKILETVQHNPGIELGALRDTVCAHFGKQQEWRALLTINGHLLDFEQKGLVKREGDGWAHA